MEGVGIRIKDNDKKNHEREHFVEKIVHSEHPREKSLLHRPSEVFHRNFSNAHQRPDCSEKLPYLKTGLLCRPGIFSIQNNILTINFYYLFNSLATVNQHSEGIKQARVPIDINPLAPTQFIKGSSHQHTTAVSGSLCVSH